MPSSKPSSVQITIFYRCPADESTSCEMDIGTLDPTINYGIYGAMDAFQMRPVYFNFTAIFQGKLLTVP